VARSSGQTFQKRQKEKLRQERQQEKAARRLAAKERPNERVWEDGQDPDLIGIRPGPQPLPEQWHFGEPEVDAGDEGAS
jgi:hypothetical protein